MIVEIQIWYDIKQLIFDKSNLQISFRIFEKQILSFKEQGGFLPFISETRRFWLILLNAIAKSGQSSLDKGVL